MKLRMIAESSIHDLNEGRWDQGDADRITREQTAKSLVVTSLAKLRNILEPIGMLKGGIAQKHRIQEPAGDPKAISAFNRLREVVKTIAKRNAEIILAGGNTQNIGTFWGLQVPTGWHDVHAGQRGKPTAEGTYDQILRTGVEKARQVPQEQLPEVLNQMGNEIRQLSQGL